MLLCARDVRMYSCLEELVENETQQIHTPLFFAHVFHFGAALLKQYDVQNLNNWHVSYTHTSPYLFVITFHSM